MAAIHRPTGRQTNAQRSRVTAGCSCKWRKLGRASSMPPQSRLKSRRRLHDCIAWVPSYQFRTRVVTSYHYVKLAQQNLQNMFRQPLNLIVRDTSQLFVLRTILSACCFSFVIASLLSCGLLSLSFFEMPMIRTCCGVTCMTMPLFDLVCQVDQ